MFQRELAAYESTADDAPLPLLQLEPSTNVQQRAVRFVSPETPVRKQRGIGAFLKKQYTHVAKEFITPGKGRSRKPKNPSAKDIAHQRRCETCVGLTMVSLVQQDDHQRPLVNAKKDFNSIRGKCAVCDKLTNMFCTGCQQHLCVDKHRN